MPICRFTGVPVQKGIVIGSNVPGVRATYLMANTPEAKAAKRKDGFLLGICMGDGQNLQFHPHDPMHMPCYVSRWTA